MQKRGGNSSFFFSGTPNLLFLFSISSLLSSSFSTCALLSRLKMKAAANFRYNLNPVVASTENDDVAFLQDFEEAPTGAKRLFALRAMWVYKEKVHQNG